VTAPPKIQQSASELTNSRTAKHYTTLSGANNCGKSYVLKNVKLTLGVDSYMVGTNRFYHLPELATQRKDPNEYHSWNSQFVSQANNPQYNYEQNYMDLSKILGNMNDASRDRLFELCGSLIGDLPPNFHPAAIRVSGFCTPSGAGGATGLSADSG
jgi:hypothetical protein